ncbi:MAG: DUF2752 domain-containing protein [Anaerolineales bacterium]|nr:DUF2752 domain-containing protein [Anaerolineales bacterium]
MRVKQLSLQLFASSTSEHVKRALFTPVLASLVDKRRDAWVLVCVGGIQLGLHLLGWAVWPCPVKETFGIPCPGCGLTTAIGLLLRGEWRGALEVHAFAPVFLAAFMLIFLGAVLPEALRKRYVDGLAAFEQRTAISTILLAGLIVYWGLRLLGLA